MALPNGGTGATNGVTQYVRGEYWKTLVQQAANAQWFQFDDETDRFGYYSFAGNPNNNVTADKGSFCSDTSNGSLYIKKTDGVNTGWELLSIDSTSLKTLTGNSGGAISPIASNIDIKTAGSTVKFVGTAGTLTQDFALSNLLQGSSGSSITTALRSSAYGLNALLALTSGNDNTALGSGALQAITVNSNNTALGSGALFSFTGNESTAVGANALNSNVSGLNNTAIGYQSLQSCTSGQNTAIGYKNSLLIVSGSENVSVGSLAFVTAVSSTACTSLGYQTLNSCIGNNNTAIGRASLNLLKNADNNTAIGYNSLFNVLTGFNNSAVGYQSGINYTGAESNNVLLNNAGTIGESGKIRIGTPGVQNAFFAAGVDGINVGSVATVVTESGNQLGTAVITAGTGISITPGANSITIASTAGGFAWSDISGAFSPIKENGYFIIGTSTATLPASPSNGDTIEFFVDHASQVLTIQATGTQIIRMGTVVSASAGSAVSTSRGDSIELIFRSTNTCWCAVDFVGTWIVS